MFGELLRIAFKGWAETNQSIEFSSWELQNISGPSRGRKDIIPKHHWSCDGNRNASVRTVWRLVSPHHRRCLPVLNRSRGSGDQIAFLPHISSGPHIPHSLPTVSFQQLKLWKQVNELHPHQLPISAALCNCSSAKHCCFSKINARMAAAQKKTCKYTTFGRQLSISYICTFVASPALGLPHGTAAKMHLKD